MEKVLKDKVRVKLIALSRDFSQQKNEEEIKSLIAHTLDQVLDSQEANLSRAQKQKVIDELYNEIRGFGPIQELMSDPAITEIMINGPDRIYIERRGKKQLVNLCFEDEAGLMRLVYKFLSPTRRHVDEANPYTEVSLKDGTRVNIIIPPLALDGPTITIRKFSQELKIVDDLVNLGTLDQRMAEFLVACIKAEINIIFSGATGVGKTTTLNVLSSYINENDRVITIEDTAELHLDQEHVVRLEARQANIEGKGAIGIREIFKNSLRMRPDRIILGEVRSAEALDMLQAICSGHKGALSVLHASSPQDVIYRLETMILTSGVPISIEVIHRQIVAAVDLIVQQEQFLDGSRKITHITQVNGLKEGRALLEDLFLFEAEENDDDIVRGKWRATGRLPVFYPLFKKYRINLSKEIFKE